MMMDWSALAPKDLVRGKDGFTWEIKRLLPTPDGKWEATLEREGRKPFKANVSGPVDTVWTQAQELERAEALVQVQLGGVVAARKGPNGVYLTPAAFSDPGSLLAHGYIFHSSVGDGAANLEQLRLWHDELHRAPSGATPHHHDPDFYKVNK